jgi:hypothetical protein
MAAERIGADHLLRLGRQAVEPVAQIDRRQARKTFVPGARLITPCPFIARSTRDSAFSLTEASTRKRLRG